MRLFDTGQRDGHGSVIMGLDEFLKLKYGDLNKGGWMPRLRARFGYLTPDDHYEMAVSQYVTPDTDWLDVGCGRFVFATNQATASLLAKRCRSLTGIDPSQNIVDNELLTHYEQCTLQDYDTDRQFDLITLRMVVEHIADPNSAVASLARLSRPGARIIIYTVNKWSPISLLSALTPIGVHRTVKKILWGGEDRDTFPTIYQMNTRYSLRELFSKTNFNEYSFEYLSDTRVSARSRVLTTVELYIWRCLKSCGITYPENCILVVYRRR